MPKTENATLKRVQLQQRLSHFLKAFLSKSNLVLLLLRLLYSRSDQVKKFGAMSFTLSARFWVFPPWQIVFKYVYWFNRICFQNRTSQSIFLTDHVTKILGIGLLEEYMTHYPNPPSPVLLKLAVLLSFKIYCDILNASACEKSCILKPDSWKPKTYL